MKVVFAFIFAIGVTFPAYAMKKQIVCQGDLPTYAFDRSGKEVPLKSDMKGFDANSDEFEILKIGADKASPYIEVSPWLGIQSISHAKKFERELIIEYNSDNETYFAVQVTGRRTKYSSSLSCEVRVDDRIPASKAVKSNKAKQSPRSKRNGSAK